MAATHTRELDQIFDNVQDLQVSASEDGLDEQASTLETVLEELRGLSFEDGEDEGDSAED
jgi:hypothetical protein